MADKFGRNYILSIGLANGKTLTVSLPFTLELDVYRTTLSRANTGKFRIYNLSLANRNQIRFNASNYGEYRPIELRAGYGTNLPVIFKGNISQAWSQRQGVNMVTEIQSYDGGLAYNTGTTSTQYPAGTPQQTIIEDLADSLPKVQIGAIGKFDGVLSRGNAYSGNTADILTQITGGAFFIDSEKANVLGNDEYIYDGSPAVQINASTGLLETPQLEETTGRFPMIFEPTLKAGFNANITSLTEGNFDGSWQIIAVAHRGIISAAVCGELITTGEFNFNKSSLNPVVSQ